MEWGGFERVGLTGGENDVTLKNCRHDPSGYSAITQFYVELRKN